MGEDPTCCEATKPQYHNYRVCSRAHPPQWLKPAPYSLCSALRRATTMRTPQLESTPTACHSWRKLHAATRTQHSPKWANKQNSKEVRPVHPKGNQPWLLIGRTVAEPEAPILWQPDAKNWLIGKDPDAGKDWRREGDDRGWDGWMASPTQWTWVWASSRRWWKTGKPGLLESMRS